MFIVETTVYQTHQARRVQTVAGKRAPMHRVSREHHADRVTAETRAAVLRNELAGAGHDGVVRIVAATERAPPSATKQLQLHLCPDWPLQHRGER
jgi:hypothetical protein